MQLTVALMTQLWWNMRLQRRLCWLFRVGCVFLALITSCWLLLKVYGRTELVTGYVIAHKYHEQLTRAVLSYYQLADIAFHWNMKVVLPHMSCGTSTMVRNTSGLIGLPNVKDHCYKYSDFYNMTAVYKEVDRCLMLEGYDLLTTLEDFLVNAPSRQFVALIFRKDLPYTDYSPGVRDCTDSQTRILSTLEKQLNHYFEYDPQLRQKAMTIHGREYRFKGVKALCVNSIHVVISTIASGLIATARSFHPPQSSMTPSLIVIIPEWKVVDASPEFISDRNFPWNDYLTCNWDTVPHGQRVLDATDAFTRSLGLNGPTIGIHIRIERLAMYSWKKCLPSLETVLQSLQLQHSIPAANIIAIHDLGAYGSNNHSCPPDVCTEIKSYVIDLVKRLGGRFVFYEPTHFGERRDKGFASLVEKEFLSRVDYLITIGNGNYQRSMVQRFLAGHPRRSHTMVCEWFIQRWLTWFNITLITV